MSQLTQEQIDHAQHIRAHNRGKEIPSSEDIFAAAVHVINDIGFLVIAQSDYMEPFRVGSKVEQFGQFPSPQPLRVIGIAKASDWISQSEILAKHLPKSTRLPVVENIEPGSRFYKVMAD